jgi:hypothetical protein
MRQLPLALLSFGLLGLAACGGDVKVNPDADRPGEDADVQIDGPPAPPMITITGQAVSRGIGGAQPVADAMIAGYRNRDETTPISAPVMTDAQGNFTMVIDTRGEALDGFIKATKAGFKETYLYPAAPIAADTTAPVNMVSENLYGTLSTLAQGNQQAGNGLIALVVVDGASATSMPVAGATVSSMPASGAYRYNQGGFPNVNATATAADGVAYMFNAPPNVAITVSAMKAGSTFTSHRLKAWPDQLTTTLITP